MRFKSSFRLFGAIPFLAITILLTFCKKDDISLEESIRLTQLIAQESSIIIEEAISKAYKEDGAIDPNAIAKSIESIHGVLSATPTPSGTGIVIKQIDGYYSNVLIVTQDDERLFKVLEPKSFRLEAFNKLYSNAPYIVPTGSKKALILAPFQDIFKTDLNKIYELLSQAGYKVDLYINSEVTVAKIRVSFLNKYDIVIIDTHGEADGQVDNNTLSTLLATREELDIPKQFGITISSDEFAALGKVGVDGKSYYALSVPWLNLTPDEKFPNSWIFASACESAQVDNGPTSLSEAFLNLGAGGYNGYDTKIDSTISNAVLKIMTSQFLTGISFADASNNVRNDPYLLKIKRWVAILGLINIYDVSNFDDNQRTTEPFYLIEPIVITIPVYQSSVIENATPSRLEMTYNLTLANIVPATSAFKVRVNSIIRTVSSVTISGSKVLLTLSRPVVNGDIVTVAYTKPEINPLQTPAEWLAPNITAQPVTNNVDAIPVTGITVTGPGGSTVINTDNGTLQLSATVTPANATDNTVTWSITSGADKAFINSTGRLTALDNGTVTLRAAANDGSGVYGILVITITNQVISIEPVYLNSVIENATPSLLEITYNITLANIVPAASAFTVQVNSTVRAVISVSISSMKVLLTLASPVVNGDVVTVAYTKPTTNPLQTASGGQAATLSTEQVTNNIGIVNTPPVIVLSYNSNSYSGFVDEIDASGSYDINKDNLTYTWIVPNNVPTSSTTVSTISFLSPIVSSSQTVEFTLSVSDGKASVSRIIPININPYKPELELAEITNVEASSFQTPYYQYNILDGNLATMWAAEGEAQWLILELKDLFSIQHVKIAFQPGQKNESYFDILASVDKVTWEPIMTKTASCSFSGDLQVFEFPASSTSKTFKFLKLVGHGNSTDKWNYFSEFRIFGNKH
jgi:uncharacterized repeat protein (TIGR02059 family)